MHCWEEVPGDPKSGPTLKMNNSKANQDTKIRFTPNEWKRSWVLRGCETKIVLLATKRWRCRISDVGICKATNDIKKSNCSR